MITSGLTSTSSRQNGTPMIGSTILTPLFRNSRSLASCVAPQMFESVEYAFSVAHLVRQARLLHELGHLLAAAEFIDELLIEPRLVDPQAGIGQQAVAIEALDVVALERAAVAPDVDVVFLHRADQHRAGHRAPDRRRVEVRHAGGGDVEGAALQSREPFAHQLLAAIDQPRYFGAVLQRAPRDVVVVGLIRLAEIRGVAVRDRALLPHPVDRRARVEAAGESDADTLADRQGLKNICHVGLKN